MAKDPNKNSGRHLRAGKEKSSSAGAPQDPKALPEQPKREKRLEEKHLVSDETLMKKYGMSRDEDGENDPDEGEKAPPLRPSDEIARKKRRNTYIIIAVITALAIGLIIWLAVPNTGSSSYENNASALVANDLEKSEGFPVSISGTSVTSGNFFTINKEVVYISDTSVVRLNQKAKPVFERSHGFYHPITKLSGDNLMVYNVGSNGFRIDNQKETVRSEEAENVLMAADVAENGRYALVTETKGYPSQLSVYLEDGSVQYKYSFSNCYVSDISLSADGSRAAVIGVTANEGALVSEVYLFDFRSETPLTISECPDTLLMAVEYCDGRALAVGDDRVVSVNESGEKTEYVYEDKKLSGYDFSGGQILVGLSPYDSATASKLTLINSKAEEVASQPVTGTVLDVSLYGDTMAVLTDEAMSSYSVNAVRNFHGQEGESQSAFHVEEVSNDIKAIALADESSAYLLGISEIQYVDY
ncbi:MAG: DUF5711 family protein [Oscillospiraceae bacterium]|nr:DUF5711 family protein [Oscillospiraceae bacterium]